MKKIQTLLSSLCLNAALLAFGLLLPHTSHAISFSIADMGDGTTRWEITEADYIKTMDIYSPEGLLGAQILLPKNAFNFDYSSHFSISFDSPIGRITNLTTTDYVLLNRIAYYPHLDELHLTGSVLDRSLGDQIKITDFTAGIVPIERSVFTSPTANIAYSQVGAFYGDNSVHFNFTTVPEPSTYALIAGLFILGCVILKQIRNRRTNNINHIENHIDT